MNNDRMGQVVASPMPAIPRHSLRTTAVLISLNRRIHHISRHWLLMLNVLAAPFVFLPLLAPILEAGGQGRLAARIHVLFAPICHQRDDRSFHILGEKVACCERCLAIYTGLLLFGIGYAASRRRLSAASLPLASLLMLPVVIDVFSQPAFQRESTWELRTLTGFLFALSIVWFTFPRLHAGFSGIAYQIEARFDRLVAEGRARPLGSRNLVPADSGMP
ncbi:MAG: DUF2085 domain-containing protein [Thermomicrobiales bacterium]